MTLPKHIYSQLEASQPYFANTDTELVREGIFIDLTWIKFHISKNSQKFNIIRTHKPNKDSEMTYPSGRITTSVALHNRRA